MCSRRYQICRATFAPEALRTRAILSVYLSVRRAGPPESFIHRRALLECRLRGKVPGSTSEDSIQTTLFEQAPPDRQYLRLAIAKRIRRRVYRVVAEDEIVRMGGC